MSSVSNNLDIDTLPARKRYDKRLFILAVGVAVIPAILSGLSYKARQTVAHQRAAERELSPPRMRFLEASSQFNRPFKLALDRHFTNERSSYYSSPALSYLDKKGATTMKLVEQYPNLWRMLEHLQLRRDFTLEETALRTFLTASASEVMDAMGEKPDMLVEFEGFERYRFLSEYGLAWYLQHYYLAPATALTYQYGTARQLIYEALHRLQFRPVPLSRHLRIPEYDRIMLLAAIYAVPEALVGRDESLRLLLKVVLDHFPEEGRFEIESHPFADDLVPLQKHMLGIYQLRSRDYEAALKNFTENARSPQRHYLRDLSAFMVVRSRFWAMHERLIKSKSVLSPAEANRFALALEEESRTVQAPNLRANIREYISLVKKDFTTKAGLAPKPASKASPAPKVPPGLPPLPPPNMPVVPQIIPSPPILKTN